jgi:hypothetical protein
MKKWWVSWYQDGDDYRPLNFPPNEGVLGWWCSGEAADGSATLVALLAARDESHAREIVNADWPELGESEWRFADERDSSYRPGTRFVLTDWMEKRMATFEAARP